MSLHGPRHPVLRQRGHTSQNNDDSDVQTVVVTMPNTNTGPVVWQTQALPPPAVRSRPATTSATLDGNDPQDTPTNLPTAAASSVAVASTLMVATQSPTPQYNPNASVAASTATAAAATSTATPSGMSTAARAGLALGVLVLFGALLVGVLLLYRRNKKNLAAHERDNEKIDLHDAPPPPPPQVQAMPSAAPSIRSESTAPRLSLRPVTQFDPAFHEQRKSGANLLNNQPASAWERRGAANASENPFTDPVNHSGPPSANPFGNNAAVDARQANIPDSPPNASPLHSTRPGNDFANPGAAIAAADIDPIAMAGAMHSVPPPVAELPQPPSNNGPLSMPASPADQFPMPASSGPAPSGPLPVAGAMAGSRSNSPAPPGPNNVHRIQLDFKASMGDELNLVAGQLVRMLHEYDDGWALCVRMDRSQQGVVPRTCLSKYPVKPRTGPPNQGPPPPGMRGPPIRSPMGPGGVPRPLSPATSNGRSSPHPPGLQPANGRMSPAPRQMSPPHMDGPPRARSNSNAPAPQRTMSPPQQEMNRPRANSASQASGPTRGPAPGPSPMNPNAGSIPARKPVPGMAL